MRVTLRQALLLAAVLLVSRSAAAQGGFRRPSRPLLRPAPAPGIMQRLGLTPQQKQQLRQMRLASRGEQARLNTEIKERRRELADLYRLYPLDEAHARLLIQRIAELERQRLSLQLQTQLDLRRILTPDQFGQFTRLMEMGRRAAPG